MTRLQAHHIAGLSENLRGYENRLHRATGAGLAGIAAHALGKQPEAFTTILQKTVVGVIPVSYGEGIIPGFAEAVKNILEFLGAAAFVTRQTNVRGLGEAVERGATVLFLSDDDDFMGINLATGKTADNSEATGKGYGAALDLMASGVPGRTVLVIGAGPVGQAAARYLSSRGGALLIHDRDAGRARLLADTLPDGSVALDLTTALQQCSLVVEATPSPGVIAKQYLTPETLVAAPGVPLGVDAVGRELLADRLIHDALEIGVATMLYTALVP